MSMTMAFAELFTRPPRAFRIRWCLFEIFRPTEVSSGLEGAGPRERLSEPARLHGEPDAVQHEPRRFLRDAKRAVGLVGRDAVLAVRHHPDSAEPFVVADSTVFHHGPDLDGGLLLTPPTLPPLLRR